MFKKIFAPGTHSFYTNLALLILRIWLGATILLNHGISKVVGFHTLSGGFPDTLGLGHLGSLVLVIFAEVVAAGLLVVGLVTRFAGLVLAFEMAVAFFAVHRGALSGNHSGELAFIYLAGFLALMIAGPGAISADKALFKVGAGKS
ncbi:MAG TPA: DoxX family protein [Verrucomicrobiae bacterium]|nr:DoxX family protein [Verrucomicrobiae bacterium]